ncbi:MAG: hypothetical protein JNK97_02950 [Zoogloea sp.]|nr:hypothetical protein [Zoogloea sp.]
MGYAISWLACRGLAFESVVARLGLRTTGRQNEFARERVSSQALDDGWILVVANRCNHAIVKAPSLAAVSEGCELVACNIEEHVMYASAECWRDGQRLWHIEHASEEGGDHLAVEGTPPDSLQRLLAELRQRPRDDDESGDFFDIPLDCAMALVGFRHDVDHPAHEHDSFQVLEALPSPRKWWAFWK